MAIFSLQTLMYILHMLQMGAQNIHSNRLDRIPIKRFGNVQYLLLEVRAVFCGAADAQQNKSRSLNFFEEIENRGSRFKKKDNNMAYNLHIDFYEVITEC